ncbi:SDR family NAD(P)-dependent oxidoreductase [bacterium]|nr:SDR family NAD(P)-dependent oxidoreductase [bacterium]
MKKNKTYVITGTTSGIGFALLNQLCKNNIVFAGYRDEEKIKKWNYSENVIPFYIDMEISESIKQAADFIKTKTDKIDTLINCAGCVVAGAVEEIDLDGIRKQFEVNTFSHLNFSKNLLPILDGGKIINLSSMASYGIFPFISPYCASKRALDILFNALQAECGNKIKYISVKPGVIATPLWRKSIEINKCNLEKNKYKKEYEYLVNNAYKNEKSGLDVQKVVSVILKADSSKHPKASYTVGKDAFFAKIISHLPQDIINNIISLGMKLKIKGR